MSTKDMMQRAMRHLQAGQWSKAQAAFRKHLKRNPRDVGALHGLGLALLQDGSPRQAIAPLEAAYALNGGDNDLQSHLATACLQAGNIADAVAHFRSVAGARQDNAEDQFNLGCALAAGDDLTAAAVAYERALALQPLYVDAINNLAGTCQATGQLDRAITLYRDLLAQLPDDLGDPRAASVRQNLAQTLEMGDRLDEAEVELEPLLGENATDGTALSLAARLQRRRGNFSEALVLLERLAGIDMDQQTASAAETERGLCLDRLGEFDEAFSAFDAGNNISAAQARSSGVDPLHARQRVTRNRDWFTAENCVGQSEDTTSPIFFVGFPRSGTTLMEEMLGGHSHLFTSGERSPLEPVIAALAEHKGGYPECLGNIDAEGIAGLRALFWRAATDRLGYAPDSGLRLVDKLPLNLVELGLVNRLFPNARIIVALRDPRDVCLSCFMQEFAVNDAMANFFTLADTAALYDSVMGLWRHYKEVLTVPWLEYRYEDLVADPDAELRRIIDFIGEPWEEGLADHRGGKNAAEPGRYVATPSRQAVSEPINRRAIARWLNYRMPMEGILPVLAPFVEEFGYEAVPPHSSDSGG